MIFSVFETIGCDPRGGYAAIDAVIFFLGEPVLLYWYGWRDWAYAMRTRDADPDLFKDYEYLVSELISKTKARQPSEPQLRDWAAREVDVYRKMANTQRVALARAH